MSKEKQIEEMAQAIFDSGVVIDGFDRAFRSVTGKDLPDSRFLKMAAHLHDAGYRKQSEVAREIFEEIEKKVKASIVIYFEEMKKEHIKDTPLYDRCSGSIFAFENMEDFLSELKKKYTEGDK